LNFEIFEQAFELKVLSGEKADVHSPEAGSDIPIKHLQT